MLILNKQKKDPKEQRTEEKIENTYQENQQNQSYNYIKFKWTKQSN